MSYVELTQPPSLFMIQDYSLEKEFKFPPQNIPQKHLFRISQAFYELSAKVYNEKLFGLVARGVPFAYPSDVFELPEVLWFSDTTPQPSCC